MADDDKKDFDLVVPFVVVASVGGPYDDDAFVAGVQYGEARRAMRTSLGWEVAIPSALVPQFDLLAMEFGWDIEKAEADDGYVWVHLKSRRPPIFGESVAAD